MTGVAAGIKLVPLIFVPYLLVTRKWREAAGCVGGFLATVVIGFVVLPRDSSKWWLHGMVFSDGNRTGFTGWAGNQSLRAIITRLTGSITAGTDPWIVASVLAVILGITAAYLLERAGYHVVALLTTALTGLLVSPISWDHHWVWIALGRRGRRPLRDRRWHRQRREGRRPLALLAVAGMIFVYAAWPDALFKHARNLGKFSLGLLWPQKNTSPVLFARHGDQPAVRRVPLARLPAALGQRLHPRRHGAAAVPAGHRASASATQAPASAVPSPPTRCPPSRPRRQPGVASPTIESMARTNDDVAALLREYAELLAITGGDPFRARNYEKAAKAVGGYPADIGAVPEAGADQDPRRRQVDRRQDHRVPADRHHRGRRGTAGKIPPGVQQITKVPGIGPKRAMQLNRELGIASVADLDAAVSAGRLRNVAGFGAKSEERILRSLGVITRDQPLRDALAALPSDATVEQIETVLAANIPEITATSAERPRSRPASGNHAARSDERPSRRPAHAHQPDRRGRDPGGDDRGGRSGVRSTTRSPTTRRTCSCSG